MCKCPSCNSSYKKRLSRKFVLRLIPKARFFKCYRCKTTFLNVPYFFSSFIIKRGVKESGREMIQEENLIIE